MWVVQGKRCIPDFEEIHVLSEQSLTIDATCGGADNVSREGTAGSVDSPSRTATTTVKAGVQAPEPSTTKEDDDEDDAIIEITFGKPEYDAFDKVRDDVSTTYGTENSRLSSKSSAEDFPSTSGTTMVKAEADTSFEVTFDKLEHGPLGWSVDVTNHDQLVIKKTMVRQNCAAIVQPQAAAYDMVKSVNGLPGCSTELCVMLQNNTRLQIELLRPKIIDVKVQGNIKLGAVLEYAEDSLGCILHEIHSGGLLAMWNSLNPSQLVKPLDRIISVNGKDAPAPQLSAVIRKRRATTFQVLSYP